jgi:hypothetical protein
MSNKVPSICVSAGHQWISTTGDNFQMCAATGCTVIRRRVCGQWIEEQRHSLVRSRKASRSERACQISFI